MSRLFEVFVTALQLGLTSFGGPIAHLGYFHREYVVRRRWLDEATFADLNALSQALPGPASSQIGMAVGYVRAGLAGAVVSWLGFTMPSALLLVLFAAALQTYDLSGAGWLHGLQIVAVAVVADAVIKMWRSLVRGSLAVGLAVATVAVMLLWPGAWTQITVIAGAALLGWLLPQRRATGSAPSSGTGAVATPRPWLTAVSLGLFCLLLIALPLGRLVTDHSYLALADGLYRSGSLVFGGGHVVLPLLEQATVEPGFVSSGDFLAGYGAAQAVPGPLFTFAAYLGHVAAGWPAALTALVAVFLPGFLLIIGVLPVWQTVRRLPVVQRALWGVQAAVVGVLLAALYDPVWSKAVRTPADALLAVLLYVAIAVRRWPAWIAVICGAAAGALLR